MMSNSSKPIFIQLAEAIKSQIIDGKLQIDDKIPSVRELAAEFEVNNNTSMHAVDSLAKENIIYQKRGMGYFVCENAREIVNKQRYQHFNEEFLPALRKAMQQLGISKEDLLNML